MARVILGEPCSGGRRMSLALAAFAALGTLTVQAGQGGTRAQNAAPAQIVAALFRDPQRVAADYGDDSSRYAALTLLYFNLQKAAPRAAGGTRASGDHPTDLDKSAMTGAAPFWLATLFVMAVLPAPMFLIAGQLASSSSARGGGSNSPVQLPESLRVIRVLGKHYPIEVESGMVLEEKVWSETHVSTTTSGGQTYVQGDQVYTTPVQVHTHSSVTTQNRVWVRGADGRESAWTFTGEAFKTRQGHIISRIVRRLNNGETDLVLLCNHSTGECATRHEGYLAAHQIKKTLPWLVTTGLGACGYVLGVANYFRALPAMPFARPTVSISDHWIVGSIAAGIIAMIFVGITAAVIRRARNRMVERQYIPALIQFLGQSTPRLVQRFAGP